jgi:hypothetical protein
VSPIAKDNSSTLAAYERLRRNALGEHNEESGLVFFMRRGLCAWLQARPEMDTDAPGAPPVGPQLAGSPVDAREEFARLMAAMLLGRLQKEARS